MVLLQEGAGCSGGSGVRQGESASTFADELVGVLAEHQLEGEPPCMLYWPQQVAPPAQPPASEGVSEAAGSRSQAASRREADRQELVNRITEDVGVESSNKLFSSHFEGFRCQKSEGLVHGNYSHG